MSDDAHDAVNADSLYERYCETCRRLGCRAGVTLATPPSIVETWNAAIEASRQR